MTCRPGPDVRADLVDGQAELLVELAPQRRLVVLAGLLPTAGRRPDVTVGNSKRTSRMRLVGIEHDAADGLADPQAVRSRSAPLPAGERRAPGPVRHSFGCSGRSPLNDLYIS